MLLHILYTNLHTLKYIYCIINCKIPYSYFPVVMLLIILCIYLRTLKCINCVINCNIVHCSCTGQIFCIIFFPFVYVIFLLFFIHLILYHYLYYTLPHFSIAQFCIIIYITHCHISVLHNFVSLFTLHTATFQYCTILSCGCTHWCKT
jgi:hypothetical protein